MNDIELVKKVEEVEELKRKIDSLEKDIEFIHRTYVALISMIIDSSTAYAKAYDAMFKHLAFIIKDDGENVEEGLKK